MKQHRTKLSNAVRLLMIMFLCFIYAPEQAAALAGAAEGQIMPVRTANPQCQNAITENQYLTGKALVAYPEPIDPIEFLGRYFIRGRVAPDADILIEDFKGSSLAWSAITRSDPNGFYQGEMSGRDCETGFYRELLGGDNVRITAGGQTYSTTIHELTNIIVDPDNNIVDGKTGAGLVVEITLQEPSSGTACNDPSLHTFTKQVNTAADGRFQATFEDFGGRAVAILRVRDGQGSSINTIEAWKKTIDYDTNSITGYSQLGGYLGNLTYTLTRAGVDIEEVSLKPLNNYINNTFLTPLQAGDEVRVTAGNLLIYHTVVALFTATASPETDQVTGRTTPGKAVYLTATPPYTTTVFDTHCLSSSNIYETQCVQAGDDGSFVFDLPYDLRHGDIVHLTIYDDEGNQTVLERSAGILIFLDPSTPFIYSNFKTDGDVTAKIIDADGMVVREKTGLHSGDHVEWQYWPDDMILQPGQIIEISDGAQTKRMTIPVLTVDRLAGSSQVSGSASDGLVISRWFNSVGSDCGETSVSNGRFSIPFNAGSSAAQSDPEIFQIIHSDEQGGFTGTIRYTQKLDLNKDDPGAYVEGSVELPNLPVTLTHQRGGAVIGVYSGMSDSMGRFLVQPDENVFFQQGDRITTSANDVPQFSVEIPELWAEIDVERKMIFGRGPANQPIYFHISYNGDPTSVYFDVQTDANGNFILENQDLVSTYSCNKIPFDNCLQPRISTSFSNVAYVSWLYPANNKPDQYEPDDTSAAASRYTGPQRHTFLQLGEEDWVRIEVSTQEVGQQFDIQLENVGQSSMQVGYDFALADGTGSHASGSLTAANSHRARVFPMRAGTYHLQLKAEGESYPYGSCDSGYSLSILRPTNLSMLFLPVALR